MSQQNYFNYAPLLKCNNIMEELKRKLIIDARNKAKRRARENKNRITSIFDTLLSFVSRGSWQHYASF